MSDVILEDLKEQIASRRVVLVIGAGVSIAATGNAPASSWTGLLKLGVRRCVDLDSSLAGDWHERTIADVTSARMDDVLAGASKVGRTLRRQNEWPRWLQDTVGTLKVTQSGLIDAIGGLDAPILTTNYDDLLERQLRRFPITWRDAADQIAFARLESRETILHLHGYWRQPESVILDVGDYERVIGDPLVQAGLQTMGETWSFVFVGCGDGLADPHFEKFLNWTGTVLKGARHRHFRLERGADVARRQQWHDARGDRVRVLSYGESYKDLSAFVDVLRPNASPTLAATGAKSTSGRLAARPALSAGEYVRLQKNGRAAVQQLTTLANQLGWASIADHGTELSETLEQDLYRVAVTGRSRTGKSTLLNALVGRAICPVERVITTAIPIIVGPGETESATVTYEGKTRSPLHLDGPITADMLAPYADQRHNANNVKAVDRIEVRLGHQVLDLGVEYVDLPGFDDPSGRIWSATNEVVRRAHALILVLDVSTYDSGGFAIDKATRELLESAQQRACPVFVVCNKADKLAPSDEAGAAKYLQDELQRFGLIAALPRTPFFLSARDATEASGRDETIPPPFATFEEALWEQLWNTESVGLRRLNKVFDALRVADEEVTALIRVRYAKGPERQQFREAIANCRQDANKCRATCIGDTRELRVMAAQAVERARGDYLRHVGRYISSLQTAQGIPAVSVAIGSLQEKLVATCRSVIGEIEPAVTSRHEGVQTTAARSLSKLREQVGLSAHAKQAREVVETLSGWANSVVLPGSGSGARKMKVVAAGGSTAAAIGWTVGGPAGWLLGTGIGLVVSAIVDHFTDTVGTVDELRERVERHGNEAITSFGRVIDDAIASAGSRLERRVGERMQPFLRDMEDRLEQIREPSADELKLQADMSRTTADALDLLVRLLENKIPQAGAPLAPP